MLACYAVVRTDQDAPAAAGVARAPVRVVRDRSLGVLVSDLPPDARADADAVLAHAAVVDAAFADGPVLPLRFPSFVADEPAAIEPLRGAAARPLRDLLDHLEGRVEVRVRVEHDQDSAIADVLTCEPALAALRNRPEHAMRLGEELVRHLRARAASHAEDLLAVLAPVVDEVRVDRSGGEEDVLVASALVPTDEAGRVASITRDWACGRPVVVDTAGPLPPYSFTDPGRR